jgi:hypothetical protein
LVLVSTFRSRPETPRAGETDPGNSFIGRRPIATFGNSDCDYQMLEWVAGGHGPRTGLIVHHDNASRDFAYDRTSPPGILDRAFDDAPHRGWTQVSMKEDWNRVFSFE